MTRKQPICVFSMLLIFFLYSCEKDDGYNPIDDSTDDVVLVDVSPVNFNLEAMPYPNLSEYNFFEGDLVDLKPVYGVLEYDVITPLFSDYALKKRFIWMPEDKSATYVDDYSIMDFPIGTILIKNFYYDQVQPNNSTLILETRLMILKDEGWVFANYKWNDQQTEAYSDLSGSFKEVEFNINGTTKSTNYRIPSESECFTCHKSPQGLAVPIGVKPQNINMQVSYEGFAENQITRMVNFGYFSEDIPSNFDTVVDWQDTSENLNERVRSYLDMNCAHCHSDFGHCSYRPMRFDFKDTVEDINLGICVDAADPIDNYSHIVFPNALDKSVMVKRMHSNLESVRMPLLGRSIKHEEGIDLIEQWILSLNPECN